jgi:hypothetical protein
VAGRQELGGEAVERWFHLVVLGIGRSDDVGDRHDSHRGTEQHETHAEVRPPGETRPGLRRLCRRRLGQLAQRRDEARWRLGMPDTTHAGLEQALLTNGLATLLAVLEV